MMVNERCWTLLGKRSADSGTWSVALHHIMLGEPARVEADWSWTLAREEERKDVMGFYHTHPRGCGVQPSGRDIRTMQAWCSALGKPLLCLIAEDGKPGFPMGYVFEHDEHRGQPVHSIAADETGAFMVVESRLKTEAD
jgi:hypothetical protein